MPLEETLLFSLVAKESFTDLCFKTKNQRHYCIVGNIDFPSSDSPYFIEIGSITYYIRNQHVSIDKYRDFTHKEKTSHHITALFKSNLVNTNSLVVHIFLDENNHKHSRVTAKFQFNQESSVQISSCKLSKNQKESLLSLLRYYSRSILDMLQKLIDVEKKRRSQDKIKSSIHSDLKAETLTETKTLTRDETKSKTRDAIEDKIYKETEALLNDASHLYIDWYTQNTKS